MLWPVLGSYMYCQRLPRDADILAAHRAYAWLRLRPFILQGSTIHISLLKLQLHRQLSSIGDKIVRGWRSICSIATDASRLMPPRPVPWYDTHKALTPRCAQPVPDAAFPEPLSRGISAWETYICSFRRLVRWLALTVLTPWRLSSSLIRRPMKPEFGLICGRCALTNSSACFRDQFCGQDAQLHLSFSLRQFQQAPPKGLERA